MVISTIKTPPVEMELRESTPEDRAQWRQFELNAAWLQAHASEVYKKHRGKHICIAGQELFVSDSVQEAVRLAEQAHPEDRGSFFRYIPRERLLRV